MRDPRSEARESYRVGDYVAIWPLSPNLRDLEGHAGTVVGVFEDGEALHVRDHESDEIIGLGPEAVRRV